MRLLSLEKIFEEACNKHEHLKLLASQWRFDKELISKALQNISSLFPHYSRHDASHSKQIIVNIERMLGERILHLTATDMWLILESAYSHDIGMVITHKQIQDMNSPEFNTFVQDIANTPEHELHDFSANWINGDATLPNGADAHVFFDEYRQILAEWYRRKHPENASNIIRNPFEEIGLSSPRNELLPKRLFGALAAICNAHGQPFDDVMKLPFSEADMATEDCHPRYVAFLLRMADLLDVDDNRFCPVMMRMCGASLPSSSHIHLEKHQGIKHFRLDSERIKIEVVCPSTDSYEIAHDWFKWLEKEYHSQSQHWPKIVPSKKLGRLPTLSPPKVSLKKPYLIISEGKKPTFDLDHSAILKLLRSTGLYTSKVDSIREILQNAVDSTIISIWESHKEKIINLEPSSMELFSLYDEKPIIVDFLPNESNPKTITLTVKDSGTGISKLDIERMLKVGNSNKNSNRSRLIRNMPEWFKPSGNFGIGLQSISLLADSFTITTKSRSSQEAFKLTFNLGKGSSVVIERIDSETVDYGATIAVDITIEDFPKIISIPWGEDSSNLIKKMNNYDFTEPGSDLKIYEQIKILQAIQEFNDGSPIKILSAQHSLSTERTDIFFARAENICFSHINFGNGNYGSLRAFFRGQKFTDLSTGTALVSGKVDFYGYQAMDFLTYNREKILPHMKTEAAEKVNKALLEFIRVKFDSMDKLEQPYAAAYYHLYSTKEVFESKYHNALMRFLVAIENRESLSLAAILEHIERKELVDFEVRQREYSHQNIVVASEPSSPDTLAVLIEGCPNTSLDLIKLLATNKGYYWQEQYTTDKLVTRCHWSHEDIIPIDQKTLKSIMSGPHGVFDIGKRILFPGWKSYRRLAITADITWARAVNHLSDQTDMLVLPYAFDHEGTAHIDKSNNLINWVYTHRTNKDLTINEIETLYDELIREISLLCEDF